MKLTTPALLTLSAFATLTTAKTLDEKHIEICKKHNPDILKAIDAFCLKPENDIIIPSNYAKAGKKVGRVHVKVDGKCKPAMWLPKSWCLNHFHDICAMEMGGKGFGGVQTARNNCQKYQILKLD